MASARQIALFLHLLLQPQPGDDESVGVQGPVPGEVRRIGLALEPNQGMDEWVRREQIDLLFIHRSYRLLFLTMPEPVGVITYQRAFDRWLFSTQNPFLVQSFGLHEITPITWREEEIVGFVAAVIPESWPEFLERANAAFMGTESALLPTRKVVCRAAFLEAMSAVLVESAAALGADVYVTGQTRQPGLPAIEQTGLGLITVGRRHLEWWGLTCLGQLLIEQFPELAVVRFGSR